MEKQNSPQALNGLLDLRIEATKELIREAKRDKNREMYFKLKREYRILTGEIKPGENGPDVAN